MIQTKVESVDVPGSDGKTYHIAYFPVKATHELYYQVRENGSTTYKELVMASPYEPRLYIDDLCEALSVDAPGTIADLKRKR